MSDTGKQRVMGGRSRGRRPDARPNARVGVRLVLSALRGYQAWVSPLFGAFGARCCFEPSCSQYALDAVQAHGPLRGLALAGWRLLRCNPFNAGGFDPVVNSSRIEEAPDEAVGERMRCST